MIDQLDEDNERKPSKSKSSRSIGEQEAFAREGKWKLRADSLVPLNGEGHHVKGMSKPVAKFYKRQNEQIADFASIDNDLAGVFDKVNGDELEDLEARRLKGVKVAIYGSFLFKYCAVLGENCRRSSLGLYFTGCECS